MKGTLCRERNYHNSINYSVCQLDTLAPIDLRDLVVHKEAPY